jgi:hypothetical protein
MKGGLQDLQGVVRRRSAWSRLGPPDRSSRSGTRSHRVRSQAGEILAGAHQSKRDSAQGAKPLGLIDLHEMEMKPAPYRLCLAAKRAEAQLRTGRSRPSECSETAGSS